MKTCILLSAAAFLLLVRPVFAQTPYAGMQTRPVKALSDQQIADLRSGRGMGLAMAAEMNGYPGPSHLLELASKIGLSDVQRNSTRAMMDMMKAETIPIGERLIAQETALDKLFATHVITQESLGIAIAEIGTTQSQLRAAHLKYHLLTITILEPSQIQKYQVLRGYDHGLQHQHNQR